LTADKAKRWPTHTNTHWHTRTSWLTNARSLGKGKVNWQSRIRWKKGVLVLRCSLFPVIFPLLYSPLFHTVLFWPGNQRASFPRGRPNAFASYQRPPLSTLLFRRLRCVSVCGSPFTFPPFTHLWLRLICFGGCHQVTVPTVVDLAAFLSRS